MDGDYLVNCIPLPTFSRIPVEPDWPEEKQFVIDNHLGIIACKNCFQFYFFCDLQDLLSFPLVEVFSIN